MAINYSTGLALELRYGVDRIDHLRAVRTIPGVRIDFVVARNGIGVASIRYDGESLSWRAPGSEIYGVPVVVSADGYFVLEDGEDADKCVIVQVYADYLEAGTTASVLLADIYGNRIGKDDITAAQAESGNTLVYVVMMYNTSASNITGLKVWLDPDTPDLEISDDNITWVNPTIEANALSFPTLAPSSTDILYIRRVIEAEADSDPSILNHLYFSFFSDNPDQRHYVEARGKYRIFNDAEYRFYRSSTGPPVEGSTPFATNASLPYTPTKVFANGTWHIACSYFNGVLDSGFLPVGPNGETYYRLDISGGSEIGSPPNAPNEWHLIARPNGVVRIVATYYQSGSLRATQWAIAYTTDESTPATDDPDLTKAMSTRGLCALSYDLPAQDNDTVVKVRLQTRRQDGETWRYSEGSTVLTLTADAEGPTAPLAGAVYPGRLPEAD